MSEKTRNPEEKPANPVPEKPALAELSDKALEQVSGGAGGNAIAQDITLNKAKTADKAFAAMDGYIKG
jgi:bacteriocin-like protein